MGNSAFLLEHHTSCVLENPTGTQHHQIEADTIVTRKSSRESTQDIRIEVRSMQWLLQQIHLLSTSWRYTAFLKI